MPSEATCALMAASMTLSGLGVATTRSQLPQTVWSYQDMGCKVTSRWWHC